MTQFVDLRNDRAHPRQIICGGVDIRITWVPRISQSAEGLARLRAGLSIASNKGRKVRTAPAKIRLIREADNPWYEVTLTEGRNRQIRRMFEEIGHHAEKIRRVRYGPLQLDVPPGAVRRLTAQEVAKLKAAAK